jgi:hypothetical protein
MTDRCRHHDLFDTRAEWLDGQALRMNEPVVQDGTPAREGGDVGGDVGHLTSFDRFRQWAICRGRRKSRRWRPIPEPAGE